MGSDAEQSNVTQWLLYVVEHTNQVEGWSPIEQNEYFAALAAFSVSIDVADDTESSILPEPCQHLVARWWRQAII